MMRIPLAPLAGISSISRRIYTVRLFLCAQARLHVRDARIFSTVQQICGFLLKTCIRERLSSVIRSKATGNVERRNWPTFGYSLVPLSGAKSQDELQITVSSSCHQYLDILVPKMAFGRFFPKLPQKTTLSFPVSKDKILKNNPCTLLIVDFARTGRTRSHELAKDRTQT